jgi:hypothetical protein
MPGRRTCLIRCNNSGNYMLGQCALDSNTRPISSNLPHHAIQVPSHHTCVRHTIHALSLPAPRLWLDHITVPAFHRRTGWGAAARERHDDGPNLPPCAAARGTAAAAAYSCSFLATDHVCVSSTPLGLHLSLLATPQLLELPADIQHVQRILASTNTSLCAQSCSRKCLKRCTHAGETAAAHIPPRGESV